MDTRISKATHLNEPLWLSAAFDAGCGAYFERRMRTENPHAGEMAWAWDLGWRFADASISMSNK
jgi:hypothetical protein